MAVTSPFFPHKLAKGYSSPFPDVVKSVNGIQIKNLAHLVEVCGTARTSSSCSTSTGAAARRRCSRARRWSSATDDILTDNGVRSQGSPDMMAVWNKKN